MLNVDFQSYGLAERLLREGNQMHMVVSLLVVPTSHPRIWQFFFAFSGILQPKSQGRNRSKSWLSPYFHIIYWRSSNASTWIFSAQIAPRMSQLQLYGTHLRLTSELIESNSNTYLKTNIELIPHSCFVFRWHYIKELLKPYFWILCVLWDLKLIDRLFLLLLRYRRMKKSCWILRRILWRWVIIFWFWCMWIFGDWNWTFVGRVEESRTREGKTGDRSRSCKVCGGSRWYEQVVSKKALLSIIIFQVLIHGFEKPSVSPWTENKPVRPPFFLIINDINIYQSTQTTSGASSTSSPPPISQTSETDAPSTPTTVHAWSSHAKATKSDYTSNSLIKTQEWI